MQKARYAGLLFFLQSLFLRRYKTNRRIVNELYDYFIASFEFLKA
jgi:hypothetical protein